MFNDLIKDAEDAINGLRQLRNATDDAENLEVIQKIGVIITGMKNEMKEKQEELNKHPVNIFNSPINISIIMHRKGFINATMNDAIDFIQHISDDDTPLMRALEEEINIFCSRRGIEKCCSFRI